MSDETLNETQPMHTGMTVQTDMGETMPTRVSGETVPTHIGEETAPTQVGGEPPIPPADTPSAPPPARKRRLVWFGVTLLAWLVLIGVTVMSGYYGYTAAIADRIAIQSTEAVAELDTQYELALENFARGEYELARQRLQYIIDKNPNYEKAIFLLGETLAIMGATATPTPVIPTATPTLTPTPDLRAVEEIFTAARAAMEAQDWDTAISTLLALRQKDPAYRAVDVDSMLYVAFRYRGVFKILNTGQLEGGLLDLTQAELFGPLDADARSYANFARLFGIGVSFWEVDWAQAVYYFGQVAPYLPNMHNGDNWYASQRYVEALEHYIDQLTAANNWCEAQAQMDILRAYRDDPRYSPTQIAIQNKCSVAGDEDDDDTPPVEPEATPTPPEDTLPPTPTEEPPAPTEETPEPTEEAPPPSETPAP